MSLNKTLDRLFDEIRREARRNPDFADRLDSVLRAHSSRRDVAEEAAEAIAQEAAPALAPEPASKPADAIVVAAPALNPVGLYQREGAEALAAALADQDREALAALIAEHNLDPTGEAGGLDRDALAAHVVAQAARRVERDKKLFDY